MASGVVDLTEDDDEAEPADPRLLAAKRPRLNSSLQPVAPHNGVLQLPPVVVPGVSQASALVEAELSSRIWDSLKRLTPGQAAGAPRAPTSAEYKVANSLIAPKLEVKAEPQESGLRDMLRDSLRSLSSDVTTPFQGSQPGQQLWRAMQMQPSHSSFLPVKQELAAMQQGAQQSALQLQSPQQLALSQQPLAPPRQTTLALPPPSAAADTTRVADPRLEARQEAKRAVKQEVKQEVKREVKQELQQPVKQEVKPDHGYEVMTEAELAAFPGDDRLPAANLGVPRPERPPIDFDDDSDDEGVPHRLPPGFGAVPEDIIQERARAREEEKIRAIKSRQPCRFGTSCKKRDCMNMHPEGRSIDTNLNPCAFGRRCKRHNCFYDHPEGRVIDDDPTRGVCRLGVRCKRADCLYTHPQGRDVPVGSVQVCFFCHEMGHIAQDCPRNPGSWAFNRQGAQAGQLVAIQTALASPEAAPAQVPAQ
mmetsp:Transcript_42331/g.75851  ORF Transcript_42331/g.75851 Transcript_42331/m.75851 type:complete len:477 (-) Transcript_42331:54-1484(-)